ncbi:ABC transporter ATP-binding protein [Ruegeria sediminis]|uniref:ABC transporter ATP-binding protein n=1 Tax=Ruegeria sediminis TaxID=2583820 RepID=A0ABY2WVR4_9RHOB|nr:ABC transporter ATP-binding protein [Ruegeria sediminis]TMV06849.1 ABC transporter ATP-binding protein [Ruegeria sediminis]
MTIAHLLERFDADPPAGGTMHLMREDALEEERLAAFEKGYAAGWEDALSAQEENRGQFVAALSRNLADLSFTYHEALARMTLSLEPMFQSLVRTVLPQTMAQGFGRHVVEQLQAMAEDQMAQPIELAVPPGASAELGPLLEREFPAPLRLAEDRALLPGQARLRVGAAERELDCRALLASIEQAMEAFIYQARQGSSHE